jgi:hypothetical protein
MICGETTAGVDCTIRKRRLKVFNVFALQNPTRLVVDVSRMPKGKSKYVKTSVPSDLEQIRTGWHPEKYRIVFDINSELSTFSWEKYGDVVRLSFETLNSKPEGLLAMADSKAPEVTPETPQPETIQLARANPEPAVQTENKISEESASSTSEDSAKPVIRAQLKHPDDSFNRQVAVDETPDSLSLSESSFSKGPATTITTATTPKLQISETSLPTAVADLNLERKQATTATQTAALSTETTLSTKIPEVIGSGITTQRKEPAPFIEAPELAAAIKIAPVGVAKPTKALIAQNPESPFPAEETAQNTARVGILKSKLAPVKTIKVETSIDSDSDEPQLETAKLHPERSQVRQATSPVVPDIRAGLLEEISATLPPGSFQKRNTPTTLTTNAVAPTAREEDKPEAPSMVTVTSSANPIRARLNPEHIPATVPDEIDLQEGQFMRGIRFINPEKKTDVGEPTIELSLTKKPHFNLSKVGPRTYRLRIMKASVASDPLLLPFFPPHTFPKISFVQAKNESGKVTVTIGVERGTRLMTVSKEKKLLITILN